MNPLECARDAALEAGAQLRSRFGDPIEIGEKALRGDLVTEADRASEASIVGRLRAAFPNSTILGEEGGVRAGSAQERWIVDPLDGTTNYAHGYPLYCVSIAYERAGELVCGVVYAPSLDELYVAEKGSGATRNGRAISVSTIAAVADAMVCTGFQPARYDRNGARFAALSRRAQAVRRDGAAALDLAFTAAGRFDAFWESDLSAWDVAAGALLVREAGGHVSAIDGSTFEVGAGSVLATNGRIHAEMIEALAPG